MPSGGFRQPLSEGHGELDGTSLLEPARYLQTRVSADLAPQGGERSARVEALAQRGLPEIGLGSIELPVQLRDVEGCHETQVRSAGNACDLGLEEIQFRQGSTERVRIVQVSSCASVLVCSPPTLHRATGDHHPQNTPIRAGAYYSSKLGRSGT